MAQLDLCILDCSSRIRSDLSGLDSGRVDHLGVAGHDSVGDGLGALGRCGRALGGVGSCIGIHQRRVSGSRGLQRDDAIVAELVAHRVSGGQQHRRGASVRILRNRLRGSTRNRLVQRYLGISIGLSARLGSSIGLSARLGSSIGSRGSVGLGITHLVGRGTRSRSSVVRRRKSSRRFD